MSANLRVYMNRYLSLALSFVASATFVGCDAGDTLPEDADLDDPSAEVECIDSEVVTHPDADSVPVVAVELDGGWKFAWYESNADGGSEFATSEVGPAGSRSPSRAYPGLLDLSPTEQWTTLTDAPVPQELRDYEKRQEAAPTQRPKTGGGFCDGGSEPLAPQEEDVNVNRAGVPCDSAWFNSTYCSGSYELDYCILDHWNGAWVGHTNMTAWASDVCPEQGNVKLEISTGGIPIWVNTALQGQVVSYVWNANGGSAAHRRSDVTYASGDKFQFNVEGECYGAC